MSQISHNPVVPVMHACFTPADDPTVGGEGWPYAGIGNGQLPKELREIGEKKRQELFPEK